MPFGLTAEHSPTEQGAATEMAVRPTAADNSSRFDNSSLGFSGVVEEGKLGDVLRSRGGTTSDSLGGANNRVVALELQGPNVRPCVGKAWPAAVARAMVKLPVRIGVGRTWSGINGGDGGWDGDDTRRERGSGGEGDRWKEARPSFLKGLAQPQHEKAFVVVTVSDTGMGMDGRQMEHLFKPFSQVNE